MSDIENLIVRRAAAMAEKDGVGVQIVHVFGATSQLSAALAEARDRLINHPGQIADTLSSLLDADEAAATGVSDEAAATGVSDELRRLVIAARVVAYEDQSAEALEELDKASEAFAELVPWEDEPDAEAERLAAKKASAEAAEAERLAAEKAAADAAEAERLAAEKAAAEAAAAEAAEAERLTAEKAAADAAAAAVTADAKAPAKAAGKAK